MARIANRLPENAPGDYFVDSSCIDCDTCRQIAPDVFDRFDAAEQSIVRRQPQTEGQRRRAAMALVACPTASIGTARKDDIAAATTAFPEPIAPGVYYCGYASESSFGAASYLICRPQGNVLIDSPRAARPLLGRIEAMGGVRTMILTHRDDAADHAIFRDVFRCERVIHDADVDASTAAAEVRLPGGEPVRLDPELLVIPVPGHTRGSIALCFRNEVLFSGDHVWYEPTLGRLHASSSVCWFSWAEQTRSMVRLLDFEFQWILPGHGRRYRAPSTAAMRQEIAALVTRMHERL